MEQKTRPPNATQPQNWLMDAAAIDPVLVHLTTGARGMLVGCKRQGRGGRTVSDDMEQPSDEHQLTNPPMYIVQLSN